MKITCVLASYNRPRMLRDALGSLVDQTYQNYEVIVVDDSTTFDVNTVVKEFPLRQAVVIHNDVTDDLRRSQNRLPMNMNTGLGLAQGDLICFLCDDDYYYPEWFESAVEYFTSHPEVSVGYGKLTYHEATSKHWPYERGRLLFPNSVIREPFRVLDHNQVIHRAFRPPYHWDETPSRDAFDAPDGFYWRRVAQDHPFHPIDAWAAVKRVHGKNLQKLLDAHLRGEAPEVRE